MFNIIISETVDIRYSPYVKRLYEDMGYKFDSKTKTATVKVKDLPYTSNAKIVLQCDYCGRTYTTIYCNYVRGLRSGNEKCACKDCRHKKYVENCMEKYGVDNTMKVDSVKEILAESCLKKYGVRNTLLVPEVREKQKRTCLEAYGANNPLASKEVRAKIAKTNLERYGFEDPMKNPKVVAKLRKSMEDSDGCCTSKAQIHIHKLVGGILNKQFDMYNVDIFIEPNIYIEYDGSGHDLNVVLGHISREVFNQKEIIRYKKLKELGLKEIRIINKTDKLPDDDVIFKVLNEAVFFLNNFNDNWIELNFDEFSIKTKDCDWL